MDAVIHSAPVVGGYLLDKVLEHYGLPSIATELGIIATLVEDFFVKEKIEQKRDQTMDTYDTETALVLAFVALPNAAVTAARVHIVNSISIQEIEKQFG